jgi:hypothetical protein
MVMLFNCNQEASLLTLNLTFTPMHKRVRLITWFKKCERLESFNLEIVPFFFTIGQDGLQRKMVHGVCAYIKEISTTPPLKIHFIFLSLMN